MLLVLISAGFNHKIFITVNFTNVSFDQIFIGVSAVIGSMVKKGSLTKKTSSVVVAAKGIKKRVLKKPGAKGRGYTMLPYMFLYKFISLGMYLLIT